MCELKTMCVEKCFNSVHYSQLFESLIIALLCSWSHMQVHLMFVSVEESVPGLCEPAAVGAAQ